MGYGNYSHSAHAALVADRANVSANEVFKQRQCHPLMNPHGLKMREARDSAEHPHSLAIAFALDVTGSMGEIPKILATRELPTFMRLLGACGVPDPQLLFMAIGDATTDHAPLQVGQFETTAELMDQWLTYSYLEGGGGGQGTESYELAFYMLAQHTDIDCWLKRRKKGYLFMTGDELPYPAVSKHQVGSLLGDNLDADIPIEEVIAAAAENYHLFFLIPDLARRERCERRWRDLLGDHVICMEDPADACAVSAAIVAMTEGAISDRQQLVQTLSANGVSAQRAAAVVRATNSYVEQLALQQGKVVSLAPAVASATADKSWWQRLFG